MNKLDDFIMAGLGPRTLSVTMHRSFKAQHSPGFFKWLHKKEATMTMSMPDKDGMVNVWYGLRSELPETSPGV